MLCWEPTSCALQLNFGGQSTIHVGDSYQGTSAIRYRRKVFASASHAPADITKGLLFHAVTQPVAGQGLKPLTVSEYRLAQLHPNTVLKVSSVVQLDEREGEKVTAAKAESTSAKKTGKKHSAKGKGEEGTTNDSHGSSPDVGAKLVTFVGSDSAAAYPENTEVELTVVFRGTVQAGDQGAIYVAAARGSDAPLLTHFEVALARWAFPCPDDPMCRIDWTLQSLQLPARYATSVLTCGSEISRRAVRGQGGDQVQLSFSTVGPLPAYVFAFAAYPDDEPLLSVETELLIPSPLSHLDGAADVSEPAAIQVSVFAGGGTTGITEATLQEVMEALVYSVNYFTDFFRCPLPMCGCEKLQLLLAPTMPYISGMEHHCCIFLNESIFANGGGSKASDKTARVELIAHEVAHHWVGNRVGFSFAVKEGICQVMEQQVADQFLGRPARKLVALSGGGEKQEAAAKGKTCRKKATDTDAGSADGLITETVKGKEFTGHSYQQALAEVQNRIVEKGLSTFRTKMREVMLREVVHVDAAEAAQGGREAMRLSHSHPQPPAYFTTEDFINLLGF